MKFYTGAARDFDAPLYPPTHVDTHTSTQVHYTYFVTLEDILSAVGSLPSQQRMAFLQVADGVDGLQWRVAANVLNK